MILEQLKQKRITYRKFNKSNITNIKNESYWFILPILELNRKTLSSKFNLVNTYLGNHLLDKEYKNCIHLIFDTKSKYNPEFNSYLDTVLTKHEYFLETYETEGVGDFGVVFFIDEDFNHILKLFKEGSYSKFPEEFIDTFFKKYNERGELSQEHKIFTKHEDIKKYQENKTNEKFTEDMEVWSKPLPEKEIYMFNSNIEIEW